VGTVKRERQKANRQLRLEQLAKQARKQKSKKVGMRVTLIVGAVVLLVLAINVLGGDDTPAAGGATTSTAAGPTTTVKSVPAPTPCPAADGSTPREIAFEAAPPTCIDPAKAYTALVTTNKGTFTVALDAAKAPNTVNNFVVLSRYHFYDSLTCHRIISGFMAQCGDPAGNGQGGPGYAFADELPADGEYKIGSLAMANSGADTQGSQFFIITGEQGVSLPPDYTLFGQVTEGFDTTVRAIEAAADPAAANGVNGGETLTVVLTLKSGTAYADVLAALVDGTLRIGALINDADPGCVGQNTGPQCVGDPGVASFVNFPDPVPVPEPVAALLGGVACIGLALFFPFGIAAGSDSWLAILGALPALAVKLLFGGFALALIETLSAKLRIFRAPEFLGTAFLLAVLAMLVNLLLGS